VGIGEAFLERCNKVGGINTPSHPMLYVLLEHLVLAIVQFLLCNSCFSVLTFVKRVFSLSGDRPKDPNTEWDWKRLRIILINSLEIQSLPITCNPLNFLATEQDLKIELTSSR